MRWTVVPYSLLFPGLGHTAAGLPLRGLAASVLFAVFALAAAFRAASAPHPILDAPFLVLSGCAAAVYLVCLADLAAWVRRLRRGARCPLKERRLRAGMAAWAASDAETAKEELRQALLLDPADVEASLLLATVLAATGDKRRARRRLRACRRYDLRGKWEWELARAMARLTLEKDVQKGG